MKPLFLILFLFLSGCNHDILTYEQLVNFPSECSKKTEQLALLTRIQKIKNFNSDPDKLNEEDRAYNSRLKATIWWYAYKCN